jgi:hypothetical protein
MSSTKHALGLFAGLTFTIALGCSAPVTIHRDSSRVRVTTCDPNRAFLIEAEGSTPAETRARAEAAIRKRIRALASCEALVTNGGLGKTRFGFREVDTVQPCSCGAR